MNEIPEPMGLLEAATLLAIYGLEVAALVAASGNTPDDCERTLRVLRANGWDLVRKS